VRRRLADFGVAGGVVVADQAIKAMVLAAGETAFPVTVIPGFFRLTFVRNRGGVFGLLNAASEPWHTLALVGIPVVAMAVLTALIWRAAAADRLSRLGLALVLGGAFGNQLDRLRLGWVVDYLDVYLEGNVVASWLVRTFGTSHWPNFNLADIAICTGAGALILEGLLHARRERARRATPADPGQAPM
jgi:signal peptidase II